MVYQTTSPCQLRNTQGIHEELSPSALPALSALPTRNKHDKSRIIGTEDLSFNRQREEPDLVSIISKEDGGSVELAQRVFRICCNCLVEGGQSSLRFLQCMLDLYDITSQYNGSSSFCGKIWILRNQDG